ncbi:hypothetical protein JCM10212_004403 [Sporobolomyces blumeae]
MQPQLPPELLYKIFSYIPILHVPSYSTPLSRPHSNLHTLALVSITSRQFHDVVEPVLHSSIDVKTKQSAELLVEALTDKPERLAWVRRIVLRIEGQLLGPPNQMETSRVLNVLKGAPRLEAMTVSQGWFDIAALQGFDRLRELHLVGPCLPTLPSDSSSSPPSLSPLSSPSSSSDSALSFPNLCTLSITLHGLVGLAASSITARRRSRDQEPFESRWCENVTLLSIHEASGGNLRVWMPPRMEVVANALGNAGTAEADGQESWFEELFPRIGAISCEVKDRDELEKLLARGSRRGQQDAGERRVEMEDRARGSLGRRPPVVVLWRIQWQPFVDYLPPWRTFAASIGSTPPARASPASLSLSHLALSPLAYSPIPSHFLCELADRLSTDPSLHALVSLWLPSEWTGVGSPDQRRRFEGIVETRGVEVRYFVAKREGVGGWEQSVERDFREWVELDRP